MLFNAFEKKSYNVNFKLRVFGVILFESYTRVSKVLLPLSRLAV